VRRVSVSKWCSKSPILETKAPAFAAAPGELKEQIAQPATLAALRALSDRAEQPRSIEILKDAEDMFLNLMRSQSEPYRLPESIQDADLARQIKKLQLLLRMSDRRTHPTVSEIADILE